MNIKKAIAAIATMATTIAFGGGLYIVSGGDFRIPSLVFTLDVKEGSETLPVLYSVRHDGLINDYIVEIDDGTVLTNSTKGSVINTNMWHTFQTTGVHKVKVFANGQDPFLDFPTATAPFVKSFTQYGDIKKVVYCQNATNLSKVVLRDGITTIRTSTFKACPSLKEVYIPDSVESLGNDVFNMNNWQGGRNALETVHLPRNSNYTNATANLFFRCDKLKSMVFPSNVKYYQKWVFYACGALESITIGPAIFVYNDDTNYAFQNISGLRTVNYYGTLEQWKADPLAEFFGTTTETPEAGVNSITISGGISVGSRNLTLNFNYPEN